VIRPTSRRRVNMQTLAVEVGEEVLQRHTRVRSIDEVFLTAIARPAGRKARAA
jgi:hypothetical protein